jgi:hypothetical protein
MGEIAQGQGIRLGWDFNRDGIAGAFHRFTNGRQTDPRGVELNHGLFRSEKNLHRMHTGQGGYNLLNPLRAFRAVHAEDGKFKGMRGRHFLRYACLGNCTGISFIDSRSIDGCLTQRIASHKYISASVPTSCRQKHFMGLAY